MDKLTKWLRLCALALLTGASLHATEIPPKTVDDFSPGLATAQDPSVICDGCAQDLLNVDVEDSRVVKRRGSILQNSTTLGSQTNKAARFLHEFVDSSGNFWLLSASSSTLYKSSDGGSTNSVLTSTHGVTTSSEFCGVNAFGYARLTDGTTSWIKFDGTSVTPSTAPPRGRTCAFFAERVWTSVGSTLHASANGDAEDWTNASGLDSDYFTTFVRQNDGYSIRAIKRFKSSLLIFKDYSIDLITLNMDGNTFTVTPVSNRVGTQYPNSVVERENDVIWLAHDGYYSYDGAVLKRISDVIEPTIFSIKQLSASQRSWTQTSQTDFTLGTVGTGVSVTTSPGNVALTGQTIDEFTDGDYTASPAWTPFDIVNSGVSVVGGKLKIYSIPDPPPSAMTGAVYYNLGISTGAWSYDLAFNEASGFTITGFKLTVTTPQDSAPGQCGSSENGYEAYISPFDSAVAINKCLAGTAVQLGSAAYGFSNGVTYSISLSRNASGQFGLYINGTLVTSATDTTFSSATYISLMEDTGCLGTCGTNSFATYDNIRFDYLSGVYQSQAFNIGTGITSWDAFQLNETLNGGTISYALYVDSNSAITISNSATYTSSQTITSGQIPTVATGTWATWTATLSRSVGTNTPTLADVTVNWNEGSSIFPVWSTYYQGSYISSVAISSNTGNDRMLVYDRNGAWTIYSYPAYTMTLYRNKPYFGSNLQGDIVRFQADNILNDYTGSAISSYWISKEFDFGFPLTKKTVNRYYVTAQYRSASDAVFEWGVDRGSLTSESTLGLLDLDLNTGFFRKSISPSSLTYKNGLSHRFKISDSETDDQFDLLSVTIKADLETSP